MKAVSLFAVLSLYIIQETRCELTMKPNEVEFLTMDQLDDARDKFKQDFLETYGFPPKGDPFSDPQGFALQNINDHTNHLLNEHVKKTFREAMHNAAQKLNQEQLAFLNSEPMSDVANGNFLQIFPFDYDVTSLVPNMHQYIWSLLTERFGDIWLVLENGFMQIIKGQEEPDENFFILLESLCKLLRVPLNLPVDKFPLLELKEWVFAQKRQAEALHQRDLDNITHDVEEAAKTYNRINDAEKKHRVVNRAKDMGHSFKHHVNHSRPQVAY